MKPRKFVMFSTLIIVGVLIGSVSLITCSGEKEPEIVDNGTPLMTVNLNNELTSVGSSKVQNNIVVVRKASGNEAAAFVALSNVCTHQSCTVAYQSSSSEFVCPCHGSKYDVNGAVVQGPAPSPLPKYTVSITDNILSVYGSK